MDNPDFRVTIELRDVAVGDAVSLAQDVWDTHANNFDAKLGDFEITVVKVNGPHAFDVDWEPNE